MASSPPDSAASVESVPIDSQRHGTAMVPVALTPGASAPSIAGHIRYARVDALDLPPDAIRTTRLDNTLGSDVIAFGPPGRPVLLRFRVQNAGAESGNWILFTGRGSLKSAHIWRLDGNAAQHLLDGTDREALRRNLRTYQAFSAEIALAPGEAADLAIVFQATDSTYLPVRVQAFQDYFADRRANIALVSGVVVGALLLVVLNVAFFVMTEQREFVWLGAAELAFAVNTLHTEGYTTIFAFAGRPAVAAAFGDIVKCLFAIAMSLFARTFIQTRQRFPLMDRLLLGVIVSGGLLIALQVVAPFASAEFRSAMFAGSWLVAIFNTLLLPVVGVMALRHVGRQYWPLVVAWGSLALFVVYTAVASSGLIAGLPVAWHWAGPVGLFGGGMATLALGLHIRLLQSERWALDSALSDSLAQRSVLESAHRETLASLSDQSSLLHASGHDLRQVVFTLSQAASALEGNAKGPQVAQGATPTHSSHPASRNELARTLRASASHIESIAATSVAVPAGGVGTAHAPALSGFALGGTLQALERIYRPQYRAKGLKLRFDVQDGLAVITDRALLGRIVSNLLSNALKFSDSGTVRVHARGRDGWLRISVTDRGRGLSKAFAKRLSQPAAPRLRADSAVDGAGSGFGASRAMARRLGGRLRIRPASQGGAQAVLSLPLAINRLTPVDAGHLRLVLEQQAGAPLSVVDLDRDGAAGLDAVARERAAPPGHCVVLTFDDSAEARARLAGHASLILLKPLHLEMLQHPLLEPGGLDQAAAAGLSDDFAVAADAELPA